MGFVANTGITGNPGVNFIKPLEVYFTSVAFDFRL